MNDTGRTQFFSKWAIVPLIGIFALAGCEEPLGLTESSAARADGTTTESIETDVAAPEAFSITDTALWDGRPTFGGVWIAYPDIETPERVRITNAENGNTVIGALYERDKNFPGPKIELSADAASALGVLAGTPAQLNIVALRRKVVEVEVEAPVAEDAPAVAVAGDVDTPLRRPTAAATAAPVPTPTPVVAPIPTPTAPPANTTPAVTTTALPPVDNTPPAAAPAAQGGIYIQVATMQSQSRTTAVVQKLETAGLDVEVRKRESGGRTSYRIVVGPASSPDALKIMMNTVHSLGYKDAFKFN